MPIKRSLLVGNMQIGSSINYNRSMPEDLIKTVVDRLFSAAASIQGTSLSQSKKTLSNYLCLLFPEIIVQELF